MKNVEIGDTIFIYVGAPIQAVLFKCRVVAVNKPFSTIDDSKFVISGERYQHYGKYMELQEVYSDYTDGETFHLKHTHCYI